MVDAILARYFARISRRQGLSRNMVSKMGTYPVMQEMIRRTIALLIELESEKRAPVLMSRQQLYRLLLERHADLRTEEIVTVPGDYREDMPDHINFLLGIGFRLKAVYPYHVYNEAMTVAKCVGLIAGWGRSGLNPDVRAQLNRAAVNATASPTQGGNHG